MKKKLLFLTLSLLGVAGALAVRPAEAASCGPVCGPDCCYWCCTTSTGELICADNVHC